MTLGGPFSYQSGFGNEFSTEAVPGALPVGQNSPQRTPFGLYAELFSGTAFTIPRAESRRTWTYRLRPSAGHGGFKSLAAPLAVERPSQTPNRLRWNPIAAPVEPTDFIDGLTTLLQNGDPALQIGCAVRLYSCNRSMANRAFVDADGEQLIVPQTGSLVLVTELGRLHVEPGQIAVLPRGLKVRVELVDSTAIGYLCENFGAVLRLPELGPIGSNGLANPRDFATPIAAFEDIDAETEVVLKFGGARWSTVLDYSPFDVVAWHGNNVPYVYDLSRFNVIGSVSFDHPDPSISTVLTSPSESAGVANIDFVVFAPRWAVAERTFRPPWFHRNIMSEYMGLIRGSYDAKSDGFLPGGGSLHNCMSAHGPDALTYERAITAQLTPSKLDDGLAFMFESRYPFSTTQAAHDNRLIQPDYDRCWAGFDKATLPPG